MSTTLAALVQAVGAGVVHGDPDAVVHSITHDSRAVRPGSMFCCVRGAHVDGHSFAEAAVAAGASALLVDHLLSVPCAQLVVDDTQQAIGPVSAAVFGRPSDSLTMVGVTGTNGKTTTTSLIASVLEAAGTRTGVIGTLTGAHTTPEAPDLQARLATFRDSGTSAVAMEVSSHALALHRVDGIHFEVGVFTNLGHDHLDLHGSIERYFAAKARLFERGRCATAVVNVDDVHGRLLADAIDVPVATFSSADVDEVEVTAVRHRYRWRGVTIEVGMGGAFNVMNSLAAATACAALGVEPATIAAGLAAASPVPGRFEPIECGQSFDVVVDYAHTPDGLEAVLTAARAVARGRVIVVFGCGGDRDRAKRPAMGAVAANLSELMVVTSDNPRSEDPAAIIGDIVQGVPVDGACLVEVEPDRRIALRRAFAHAAPGDLVVIAGKGHETTQTIGAQVLPFDDRLVARDELRGMR